MTWQLVTAANAITGIAYLAITYRIFRGLRRTGQLVENRLGTATALIFFTGAVHHIGYAAAMHQRADWETVVWDFAAAIAGAWYLALRSSYGPVLRGVRRRQALEINDNIVQGLTVAKYALDAGDTAQTREAVEETLRKARTLISDLLGESGGIELLAGELQRETAASIRPSEPA